MWRGREQEASLIIAVISDYAFPGGGAEKVAIDSAIGLARTGVEVHFITAVGPVDPALRASGVQVHLADIPDLKGKGQLDLLVSGLWSRRCAALVERVLAGLPRGRTLIHVHAWQRALTAASLRAARASGHPMILTLHEYGTACPNQGFFDYQRFEICTRRALGASCLLTHCDTRTYAHKLWRAGRTALQQVGAHVPSDLHDVIYVSEFSRAVLEPYFARDTRWHAVRNPIPVVRRERIRAEDNREFVFVGRVTPEKGAKLFAAAAEQAHVPATLAGDGPLLAELREAHPGVRYLGWLSAPEVEQAFERARALVFPSLWYETQGMVVQEALARGIPLIVADRTAAREAVRPGENGLLFRHMDANDLATQMRRLSSDDALVQAMSERGYEQFWRDPPSLQQHVERLREVYAGCLARAESKRAS